MGRGGKTYPPELRERGPDGRRGAAGISVGLAPQQVTLVHHRVRVPGLELAPVEGDLDAEGRARVDAQAQAARPLFRRKPMPTWGSDLSGIDFDHITYFVRSTEKQAASWEELPTDIKNTCDRLGIPEAEKQRLIAPAGLRTDGRSRSHLVVVNEFPCHLIEEQIVLATVVSLIGREKGTMERWARLREALPLSNALVGIGLRCESGAASGLCGARGARGGRGARQMRG